ncbi:MAG: helix-turn-helix domain-containing protein [Blautia sp.]
MFSVGQEIKLISAFFKSFIKYRLARIEEITGCSLEDASVKINFHVALYLQKFIL